MFPASRGRQCQIRLSVWKMGLVPRIFEKGLGEMKPRVGGRAKSLTTVFRVEIREEDNTRASQVSPTLPQVPSFPLCHVFPRGAWE